MVRNVEPALLLFCMKDDVQLDQQRGGNPWGEMSFYPSCWTAALSKDDPRPSIKH